MQIGRREIIFFCIFLFLSSLAILFAIDGYPLLGGDSYSFLPTAIHIHRGDGLINVLYAPTGDTKMLFYPPLFPYFQSLFLFTDLPNELFISLSITSICTLFVMMLVFYKMLKPVKNEIYAISIFLLLMLGISTGLDTSSGRPEILVNLLLSIALLTYISAIKYDNYIYGVLLVLIGITSPVTSIYCIVMLVLYYSYKKKNFISYVKVAISSSMVFLLFLAVYPYSFIDLLHTMASEAQKLIVSREEIYSVKEFVKYHLIAPNYTFYFMFFVASVVIVFKNIYKSIQQLGIFFMLVALVIYFGFRTFPTNYYVYNIYLICFTIVAHEMLKKPIKLMLVAMLLLASVGFVRKTFLYFYFVDDAATITAVHTKIKDFNIDNYRSNSSFWVYYYYQNNTRKSIYTHSIFQQAFSSEIKIENPDVLLIDFTRNDKLNIGPLTIANNPPFYYYKLALHIKK